MGLNQILEKRRSHRAYLPKKVDRDLILELLKAAQMAPASCNLQLIQYIVVDNPEILSELAKKVSYKFAYAPVSIVVLNDPRFTVERKSAVMTAGMAVENIILKAVDLGLGSVPMAGFKKDNIIKKILNIPEDLDILLLLALGYPDNSVNLELSNKINLEETFRYNSYSNSSSRINDSLNLKDHTPESIRLYRYRISSVYLDRFRLHTWSDKYYKLALDLFLGKILPKLNPSASILDVFSYDGYFLKILFESGQLKQKIYASDYLDNTLNFFKKKFPITPVKIDHKNDFDSIEDQSIDCATFIFGLSFTPQSDLLASNLYKKIKPGGLLYCTVVAESWYRRLGKFLRKLKLRFNGKFVNIYENNPFYKIGPYQSFSSGEITSMFCGVGLVKDSSGCLLKDKKNGIKLQYYIFKKPSK